MEERVLAGINADVHLGGLEITVRLVSFNSSFLEALNAVHVHVCVRIANIGMFLSSKGA